MPTIRSSPPKPCGITYFGPSGVLVYLPLEQLDVHAEIVDVSATVTLTQTFWQYSSTATPRAKYVFPVPAQAAVCGFEMRTEDGRVITAVAKEKETARKEHEQAIQQGQMTGLVEHVTDDVFTISLGCLPHLQTITTKLTYVMDLMEDDFVDQVRFQLPISVGMRYGTFPSDMINARTTPSDRIKISVNVCMKGAIQSMTSPSHPLFVLLGDGTIETASHVHRQMGQYHSPSFLSEDFVLSIKAEGLDSVRCFAEHDSTGTVAMQLTLVPKFTLPPIANQEYIFLVDRSGSMAGDRIETAKRALVMLMRALPSQGTTFNILSFGSSHSSLWGESTSYNEQTLEQATQHVDSMNADFGGTEIRAALEYMFKIRNRNVSTACFVLTDGEAYDINPTIAAVTNAVSEAKAASPLRVFTLGIGETTSTAMCGGIARAGKGVCLMAATSEAIVSKCSKLVKASRAEIVEDVTIDWGSQQLGFMQSESDAQRVELQQGPKTLPPLYAGSRLVVFAIIKKERFAVPKEVVVQAKRGQTGEVLRFAVPIETLSRSGAGPDQFLIHTLAARRVIMDLEDRERGDLSPAIKKTIIHLGEQYQLASRFTSFIAVEGQNQEKLDPTPFLEERPWSADRGGSINGPSGIMSMGTAVYGSARGAPASHGQQFSTFNPAARGAATTDTRAADTRAGGTHVHHSRALAVPQASPPSPQAQLLEESEEEMLLMCSWQPRGLQNWQPLPRATGAPQHSEGAARPRDDVERLIRLQSFDGSFAVTEGLTQILGRNAMAEAQKRRLDERVWATVLAIAYLQKHLVTQPELLEGLVEKATAFVEQSPGVDFDALLQLARGLVA